jgi:crotonobetainyl-CoA:carnitine CoA-transferase CaiB-like acyl-CoA transferase
MTHKPGLLDGIRIIDLTRVLAGPYCTQMLGDLGADVIKIEAPGLGDDTRHWGPPFTDAPDGQRGEAAYFLSANRNKRSLTLNLKSAKGLEILKSLIRQGDVLVENFRTGTLARWGLDYETLQQLRPGLIYCTITGYGSDGPYQDRAGYDFMVQAMGGFMSVTGPADGSMTRAGIAIADLSTGIFASNAILAALFARERTGEGQRIDMALLDSQVALMSYVASNYLVSGELPGRFGNGHPNIVPYQEFQASDQQFAFACGNDHQWRKFCTAVPTPTGLQTNVLPPTPPAWPIAKPSSPCSTSCLPAARPPTGWPSATRWASPPRRSTTWPRCLPTSKCRPATPGSTCRTPPRAACRWSTRR